MSDSYVNVGHASHLLQGCIWVTHLYALWELQRPREPTVPPLADGVPAFLTVGLHLTLGRRGEPPVVHLNVDVLFLDPRELKRGDDGVGLRVFV